MADREKVIERLKRVSYYFKSLLAVGWQGNADIYREHRESVNMAISLLKEQGVKTGHWTISEYEYLDCSCCGESYYTGCDSMEEANMRLKKGFYFKYCPYCGAKMEGR